MDIKTLAAGLEISATALGNYEQGSRLPDAKTLALYRSKYGVDLDWLLLEEGAPPSPAGVRQSLDAGILRRLGEMVGRAHAGAGVKLPKGAEFEAVAGLYNEFLQLCSNPAETPADVVDAMLGVIEARFKARLSSARAEPGTGKRLA
ncbi:putative Transcriptional regulator [uncultured Pleomorphomonas sp.]|uniref:Putative Transcriptional regulator n=2 Tax=uncultured Pleomorphomonas sp. TaxID=442121 RepID=A0A212LDH1_9HYPH|nr:putative Transcriptional regulator [uncultured Pleomorphomonas sp.]